MGVQVEKEGDGRWVVKAPNGDRVALILGGSRHYQAQTLKGDLICNAPTISGAIALAAKHRQWGFL